MSSRKNVFEKLEQDFDLFEWNDEKCELNFEKHHIDFDDAITIFGGPIIRKRSDRDGETRHLAVGLLEGIEIAVIYTERNGVCRVISARRARKNEREAYHEAFPGGP